METRIVLVSVLALLLCAVLVPAENILLFDFEDGAEGWENEADNPVSPQVIAGNARQGTAALGFEYAFRPKNMILHCRVKENFPQDYSSPEFQGFSAWIYIPNGKANWEAKMFARSGAGWKWSTGKTLKDLQPGWHRIEISRDKIADVAQVQDIGFQVINYSEDVTSLILVDRVEAVMIRGAEPHGHD